MRRKTEISEIERELALVYCRVSTKGQEDGTSLHTQAEACIKHAESLGYTVGKVTKEVFSELWDRPLLAKDQRRVKVWKVSGFNLLFDGQACERPDSSLNY